MSIIYDGNILLQLACVYIVLGPLWICGHFERLGQNQDERRLDGFRADLLGLGK